MLRLPHDMITPWYDYPMIWLSPCYDYPNVGIIPMLRLLHSMITPCYDYPHAEITTCWDYHLLRLPHAEIIQCYDYPMLRLPPCWGYPLAMVRLPCWEYPHAGITPKLRLPHIEIIPSCDYAHAKITPCWAYSHVEITPMLRLSLCWDYPHAEITLLLRLPIYVETGCTVYTACSGTFLKSYKVKVSQATCGMDINESVCRLLTTTGACISVKMLRWPLVLFITAVSPVRDILHGVTANQSDTDTPCNLFQYLWSISHLARNVNLHSGDCYNKPRLVDLCCANYFVIAHVPSSHKMRVKSEFSKIRF